MSIVSSSNLIVLGIFQWQTQGLNQKAIKLLKKIFHLTVDSPFLMS